MTLPIVYTPIVPEFFDGADDEMDVDLTDEEQAEWDENLRIIDEWHTE